MTQSAVEKLEKQILKNGLPEPEREFRFDGNRKWAFDFAWPQFQIAMEVEGGVYNRGRHVRPKGFTEDIRKYNSAGLKNWLVLRATSEQVREGEAIRWLIDAIANLEQR